MSAGRASRITDRLTTGKELGRGAYGQVFEVDYMGTLCATKQVHPILLEDAEQNDLRNIRKNFLAECRIWSKLLHPNIVQFLGTHYDPSYSALPMIVMEKMQLSLRNLIEVYDNIPLNVKLSILKDVSLGLSYLHSRDPPIIHRDLTPNNILLSHCLKAKITDMGVAKALQTDAKTMTQAPGTVDFMPPESLAARPKYGLPLDVFSYGGVIIYTTTQQWPKPESWTQTDLDGKTLYLSEVKRRQQYIDKMTGGAAELKPLVKVCLDNNPAGRPTIVEVSKTITEYAKKTETSMGRSIDWLVDVSDVQLLEQQRTPLEAQQQIEAMQKQIDDLRLKLNIYQQFMEQNKKVMKAFKKFKKA